VALEKSSLLVLSRDSLRSVTLLHPFIGSRLFYNLATDVSCRWVTFIDKINPPTSTETVPAKRGDRNVAGPKHERQNGIQ